MMQLTQILCMNFWTGYGFMNEDDVADTDWFLFEGHCTCSCIPRFLHVHLMVFFAGRRDIWRRRTG